MGGDAQAGGGVELDELDAGPVRAVGEPEFAVGIENGRGGDGVEVVAARGLNDDAEVGPVETGDGGIEGGIGGHADGGGIFAKGGDGEIDEVFVFELNDIGRPERHAGVGRHNLRHPGGGGVGKRR